MVGGWRRLHNEELCNLYASSNVSGVIKRRRVRWKGHLACLGKMTNAYKILGGKPERTRPQRRPSH
jgi:hypothetical protein